VAKGFTILDHIKNEDKRKGLRTEPVQKNRLTQTQLEKSPGEWKDERIPKQFL
jgi:hypothetical protein